MDGPSMQDDAEDRETVILNLSDIRIRDLPTLENAILRESLEHILDEGKGQPVSLLAFQSAL